MSCDMSCYTFVMRQGTDSQSVSCNATSGLAYLDSNANGEAVGATGTSNVSWITNISVIRNQLTSEITHGITWSMQSNLTSSSRSGTIVLTQEGSGKTISISVEQEACASPSCTCSLEGYIDMTMGSSDPSYNTLEVAYCLTARKSASTCNITKPTATMIFFDKNAAQNVLGEKDLSLMNWDSPYCGTEYYTVPTGTQLSNIMCQLTSTSGCVTRDVTINK